VSDPLASALHGHADAWNTLVHRHNHQVVVALVAVGARPCEARECAQEAWIRLLQKQRAGQLTELTLPGLAIRQARFLWLDQRRKQRNTVDLQAVREQPSGGPGTEEHLLGRAQLRVALEALDRCTRRDRELFEAAYSGQGLSQSVLAQRFGLSLQRTRQVLTEVRATLRRALGDV
jgi:RNA polymerase sigma factor (sigma-70 family)